MSWRFRKSFKVIPGVKLNLSTEPRPCARTGVAPNGTTSHPKLLSKVDAQYSAEARNAGLQGTVAIQCDVGEDGVPKNIQVVQRLDPRLDQNAIEAVKQWRFQPAMANGNPVKWEGAKIEVAFRLGQQQTDSQKQITMPTEPSRPIQQQPALPEEKTSPSVALTPTMQTTSPGTESTVQPTKAELKKQQKASEQAVKEAAKHSAREAQMRNDHLASPMNSFTTGCVSVDNLVFHKDVERGWGGLMGGGRNAVLGITASVSGLIHNNCNRVITLGLEAVFYDSSGVAFDNRHVQLFVNATQLSFVVPGTHESCYLGTNSCTYPAEKADSATLQIY